jgi:hypothetical protein
MPIGAKAEDLDAITVPYWQLERQVQPGLQTNVTTSTQVPVSVFQTSRGVTGLTDLLVRG